MKTPPKASVRFFLSIWAALVCALVTHEAQAVVIKVWYRPTDAPACCTDAAQMSRVIQQTMHEWEQHSLGAVQFDWQGTTYVPIADLPDGSTHDKIVILWDLTQQAPGDPCAQVVLDQPAVAGRVYLRPTVPFLLNSSTIPDWFGVDGCQELRGVLTHEFAHILRDSLHFPQSVLNSATGVSDVALIRRHLWNDDINGVWAPWFPRRAVALSVDLLQSNGSIVNGGGTVFPAGTNHTGSIGAGGPGFNYSHVSTTDDHIWFQQGTGFGAQWSLAQELSSASSQRTYHRTCVASSSLSSDMLAVWAADGQQQWNEFVASEDAGTRQLVFVESHNGGSSWSSPTPIASSTATTRSGISCQFDVTSNRFVLAFADRVEEIRIAWRLTPGGSAWSAPTRISSIHGSMLPLRTAAAPALSFDEFDYGHVIGLLTWWDDRVNDHRAMWIRFHQGQGIYIHDSGFFNDLASTAEEDVLRTTIVPNVILGYRYWAFGTQALSVQGRWRRNISPINGAVVTSADFLNTNSAQYFDWYVGAAANRQYVETAYLRHIA